MELSLGTATAGELMFRVRISYCDGHQACAEILAITKNWVQFFTSSSESGASKESTTMKSQTG